MHHSALVIIPPTGAVRPLVDARMAPYDKNAPDGRSPLALWDCWTIGGRWGGVLGEHARLAAVGPGEARDDMAIENNIARVADLREPARDGDVKCWTLILDPKTALHCQRWDEKVQRWIPMPDWKGLVSDILEVLPDDWRVVAVDYHS